MSVDPAGTVPVPGSGLRLSRLGYGTARLHSVAAGRERRALLERAAAAGLTHIDTAPLYGFGLTEREIGVVLGSEPCVTIATKVGLYPPGGPARSWPGVTLRKAAGKLLPGLSRAEADFAVRRAERSLGESLRRLGRERLDLLLVHEPDFGAMQIDEWQGWLDRERDRGRIRLAGLAGSADRLARFAGLSGPLVSVWQSPFAGAAPETPGPHRPFRIAYGVFSGAARGERPLPATDRLDDALDRFRTGTVLVSTRRRDRIDAFRAALERQLRGRRHAG